MFVFFLSIGRYFEMQARHRLSDSSGNINSLLPKTIDIERITGACVVRKSIVPADIEIGDQIQLRKGDIVPFDGQITGGRGHFDEGLVTGESTPVTRVAGESVLVGSRLTGGTVMLEARKLWADSSLARIDQLVRTASADPAQQEGTDKGFARYFVAWVLVLTCCVGAWWAFTEPERWFEIVLAMLVASCPCAFSLAAPVARTAAAHTLRRCGILLNDPMVLSKVHNATHWFFDKTGTLTAGKPIIEGVQIQTALTATQCLQLCASLERQSEHPFANAFRAYQNTGLVVEELAEKPGCGVTGKIDGTRYYLGRREWVQAVLIEDSKDTNQYRLKQNDSEITNAPNDTASELVLATKQQLLAAVFVHDPIRNGALALVNDLQHKGISVAILSGDKSGPVNSLAKQLGDTQRWFAQSPADKLHRLQQAQSDGGITVMVGDGLNDAPVLAGADISIALASGSELSQYNADVILLRTDLTHLTLLNRVAESSERITQQNKRWALLYNAIVLPLAAFGFLTPWLAAIGMSMSSLLVVLNALRIRRLGMQNIQSSLVKA